jgi:hypothetical protein
MRQHNGLARGWLAVLGAAVAVLCFPSPAWPQQATERFIPIERSPGLSQKSTSIGRIEAIDAGRRTVTLSDASGSHQVLVNDRTRIWLDRTGQRKTNVAGRFADLGPGLRIEVRYADPGTRRVAAWIKVILRQ